MLQIEKYFMGLIAWPKILYLHSAEDFPEPIRLPDDPIRIQVY